MASTSLEKTFGQVGNRQTWTFSAWIKRAGLGTGQNIFASFPQSTDYQRIMFNSSDKLYNAEVGGGATAWEVETDAVYRDTSAWYHLVLRQDTTEATADNRVRIYINNVQQTFGTNTQPAQNRGTQINTADVHKIGKGDTSEFFDGEMSHIHWCDGQSYAPTEFGEYDANGVWKIITEPSVTYGTNGFFILENGNSVTDQSGNGNNWTVAGGTLTNTEDNPSNVFCTYNPLATSSYGSLTHGNLRTIGINNAGLASTYGTISTTSSGKWYWEIKINNTTSGVYPYIGIGDVDNPNIGRLLNDSGGATGETNYSSPSFHYRVDGGVYIAGSLNATYSSFAIGDIISFAVDMDNGASYIAKNGTWQNSGDPTSGASKTGAITTWTASSISGFLPSATFYYGASGVGNSAEVDANFGNGYFGTTAVSSAGTNASGIGIFEYDVPTGFTALSTKGLNL